MPRVAYITSGKVGLHSFTYKELELLEKNDINFVLCLTQLKEGPFMPSKKWRIIVASYWDIFKSVFEFFLRQPIFFLKLMIDSLRGKTFLYFLIAVNFFIKIKGQEMSSVHCQMGDHKLFIGYFLSKLLNKPLTVTIHAHELYSKQVYESPSLIRKVLNYCAKIITISEFNKRELVNRIHINPINIEIMRLYPCNINNNEAKNKKKILVVANWIETKGYKILLEALREIKRNDYILWAVGGPIRSKDSIDLRDLVKNYQLEDKVIMFGHQPSEIVTVFFETCDIFCLPSITYYDSLGRVRQKEGIPVALMEAMYCGKPVITTFHAGIPELVDEILVKEGDVEELREKLIFLLDNPQKWKELGERNQKIISERYTSRNISTLINIFSNLANT